MKRVISAILLISMITVVFASFTSCNKKQEQGSNEITSREETKKTGTEGVENAPNAIDEKSAQSIKEVELKDANGTAYKVAFVGTTKEETVENPDKFYTYQKAEKGNVILHGAFGFKIVSDNAKDKSILPYDTNSIKNTSPTFNKTKIDEFIQVVKSEQKGSPDILAVCLQDKSSSIYRDLYYIKDGKIQRIQYSLNGQLSKSFQLGAKFVQTGPNEYVDTIMSNGEEQMKNAWTLDIEKGTLTHKGTV